MHVSLLGQPQLLPKLSRRGLSVQSAFHLRKIRPLTCEECRELTTHEFRTPEDLIHAVRLAGEEMNRGVLERMGNPGAGPAEREALESSLASGALPDTVRYRFRCTVCGDLFTLVGDTTRGSGGWTREATP